MLNLLCAADGIGWTIALVGLLVLMVVYLIFGTINRRKSQEQALKMLNDLKKGDKVVTNAGVYGEVVSMRETNMGKVVVIKTGHDDDAKRASFLTVNASVILGIDRKEDLILDKDGNVIESAELKEQVLEPKAQEVKETKKETKKPTAKTQPAKTAVEKKDAASVAKKPVTKKPAAKKPSVAKKPTAKKPTEKK